MADNTMSYEDAEQAVSWQTGENEAKNEKAWDIEGHKSIKSTNFPILFH